jgi:hypothetical protein
MTTDKLSAAMWGELAEAHAEAGHEYDAITRACRRRGDESARREGVEDTAKRPFSAEERNAMLNGLVASKPTPAPPPDERAELPHAAWDAVKTAVEESLNNAEGKVSAYYLEHYFKRAGLVVLHAVDMPDYGARIAELERERDDAVKIGHAFASDAEAAKARAEAAEARVVELEATQCGEAESWPVWADKIVNLLVKYGFEPGDGGWNLPDDLAEWIDGIDFAAHAKDAKEEAAALRSALRAAMDDVPGWYDLARAAHAFRAEEPGNG